jgi:uncharacterized membrane protein
MIDFQTSIKIERPIQEVFSYVSDPGNLPAWNAAVRAIRPTTQGPAHVGSTYSMERQLPAGRATNQLEIVVRDRPSEFVIRTTSGPTPFLYRYRFASADDKTVIHLDGQVVLPAVAELLPRLGRRAVKQGVNDNLMTLKLILERA